MPRLEHHKPNRQKFYQINGYKAQITFLLPKLTDRKVIQVHQMNQAQVITHFQIIVGEGNPGEEGINLKERNIRIVAQEM